MSSPALSNSAVSGTVVAWFDPVSGIAGDMALGALLDAGAELEFVIAQLHALAVDGWHLACERVRRNELAATRALVDAPESHHHRRWSDMLELLGDAPLVPRVRSRALAVFESLAHAEGEVHGIAPEQVHFHEVGALDAIVDIVGVCAALDSLGVDEIYCGPVAVGTGTIRAAHGVLPNPPPAVVRLLLGRPIVGVEIDAELTTPTGAAIVSALARRFGPVPAMTVTAAGFGAGSRELPGRANVTGVLIGTLHSAAGPDADWPDALDVAGPESMGPSGAAPLERAMAEVGGAAVTTELVELAANLDDVTGELLGHAVSELVAAGALDAWATPIVMKKGRPAQSLTVLCPRAEVTRLADLIARLTGTLGLRARPVVRTALERRTSSVEVDGHNVVVKHGPYRSKPEWDAVVAAAEALGRTPTDVARAAEAQAAPVSAGRLDDCVGPDSPHR
ncbi:nickel pincer cofactor biosynthesis protein LarC [Candidatus Poriferisodalis sp.]|uniref:nickel pincer cofactor biosynthesis protein LarC n=1 Tax=Candidatus Poriferisodalis sp. TaxID=3101277 RepID=UPI003B020FBC